MPQGRIQAKVNSIARQQAYNQFGAQRYALLFEPGTYGTAAHPLYLQVGYYTSVDGVGVNLRRYHPRAVDSPSHYGPPARRHRQHGAGQLRSLSDLTISLQLAERRPS
jgi:hypothetical protein